MKTNKFIQSLIKIAEPLFSTSMGDRYNHLTDSYENNEPDNTFVDAKPKYMPMDKDQMLEIRKVLKKKPTFKTAPAASTKITPKSFDYLAFSKSTNFSDLAPFIVEHETGGKSLKSTKANSDGTYDYGFYQINDNNLSRDKSGGALADAFDPIFEKYYKEYKSNYEGKKEGDYTYPVLTGENSKDLTNRKTLLQIPNTTFNNTTNSLSYDLAESLYNLRGIESWATKDKVISSYNDNQVASN